MELHLMGGGVIECSSFRAIDSGVLLFGETTTEDEEADEEDEANGFVPHREIRFVLSEEHLEQLGQQPPQRQQQPPQGPVGQPPHQPGDVPGPGQPGTPPGR